MTLSTCAYMRHNTVWVYNILMKLNYMFTWCNDIVIMVFCARHWSYVRACIRVFHDDVIKWKHFPRYWPFVRGIHRSPVNSPHKGQWRGAMMFSLICVWINGWESWGWWFETLSRPLWRHCNELIHPRGVGLFISTWHLQLWHQMAS